MRNLECDECCLPFFDLNQYFRHRLYHNNIPRTVDDILKVPDWTECPMSLKGCETLNNFVTTMVQTNGFKLIFNDILEQVTHNTVECNHCLKQKDSSLNTHNQCHHKKGIGDVDTNERPPDISSYIKNILARQRQRKRKRLNPTKNENQCNICFKELASVEGLIKHIRMRHDPNRERPCCDICGKTFYNNNNLKYHRLKHFSHTTEKPKCHICTKVFKTIECLKGHIRMQHDHNRERPCCNICNKTFFNESSFKRHKLDQHGTEENTQQKFDRTKVKTKFNTFKCDICSKLYKSRESLYIHKRMLHDRNRKRPHCDICNKTYYNEQYFRRHACNANETKNNFNISRTTITQEIQSDISSKIFKREENTIVHKKSSHKLKRERPYCNICNKMYVNKNSFKRHVLHFHNDIQDDKQKSYFDPINNKLPPDKVACDHCSKVYNTKKGLLFHIKTKHNPNRKFPHCNICNKTYSMKYDLNRHYATYHEIDDVYAYTNQTNVISKTTI